MGGIENICFLYLSFIQKKIFLKNNQVGLKKSKTTGLSGKIFLAIIVLWIFVLMPYLYFIQNKKRKFYTEKGVLLVTGVCTEETETSHGKYIHYKFKLKDTLYYGSDKVISKIYEQTKTGDSITIQVSFIDPEYNYLE
ncbi:MAG: hypothetical protein AB8G15_19635 [Saprospiraceae bacterium]